MDVSYCSAALLPEIHSQLPFDYEALMGPSCWAPPACDQASDSGYFSATGSSLSPTSSVDSFSFSPAHLSAAAASATTTTTAAGVPEPDDLECLLSSLSRLSGAPEVLATVSSSPAATQQSSGSSSAKAPSSSTASTSTRRSWSRFPGRKRQTASEREKMRMRDLTKSLNYLRSFLPASVAPVEQTLTKIETLRLTMQYISHLSAQLGHGDPESAPEARGTATAPPAQPTHQNLPATFQPMVEQPLNVGYVAEEPHHQHHHHHHHHYRHPVMDTVEQAGGVHQLNQATQHQIPLQNYYQVCSSPWLPF